MGLFLHLFSTFPLILPAPQSDVSPGGLVRQVFNLLQNISQESSLILNAGSCLN